AAHARVDATGVDAFLGQRDGHFAHACVQLQSTKVEVAQVQGRPAHTGTHVQGGRHLVVERQVPDPLAAGEADGRALLRGHGDDDGVPRHARRAVQRLASRRLDGAPEDVASDVYRAQLEGRDSYVPAILSAGRPRPRSVDVLGATLCTD